MQATCPVHCDITFVAVQSCRTLHTTTGTDAAELEQAVEHRTVITDIVPTLLFSELFHVVGCDLGEEVDVFVGVELRHLVLRGRFRTLHDQCVR